MGAVTNLQQKLGKSPGEVRKAEVLEVGGALRMRMRMRFSAASVASQTWVGSSVSVAFAHVLSICTSGGCDPPMNPSDSDT